jgi:hypothetical protein
MMNLVYSGGRTATNRAPRQLPPVPSATTNTASTAPAPVSSTTGGPTLGGTSGPGNVQFNPDGTIKGVQTLQTDPAAPTEIDQTLIEGAGLNDIVAKLGGTPTEAELLRTTPGTWSNVPLTAEEASAAKLEGLTPTEYAVRKGLFALRQAKSGTDTGGTIILPPPTVIPAPTTTPQPMPTGTPVNVSINSGNMNIALLAVGGALAVYLLSKMG